MIQFNLLPDVKIDYIRVKRMRRLIALTSIIVTILFVSVFAVLMAIVYIYQDESIKKYETEIADNSRKLSNTEDINKILTIQNQLGQLTKLHDSKVASYRIYDYLYQMTPSIVGLNSFNLDFKNNTIQLMGNGDSLSTINKYVDTFKFTKFTYDKNTETKAFSKVVLSSFSRSDKNAQFSISMEFDPLLFDSTKGIKLIVPETVSTRSETEKPETIFNTQKVN